MYKRNALHVTMSSKPTNYDLKVLLLQILEELHHIRIVKGIPPVKKELPENHYRTFVSYENPDFDKREWELHWLCDAEELPQDRVFLLKYFNVDAIDTDQVYSWCSTRGYRPATHKEAIAFSKEFPEHQNVSNIVAIGDHCTVSNQRHCAVIQKIGYSTMPIFSTWNKSNSFLLVRV